MWHEPKVRVQKALALGRAVFVWLRVLVGSASSRHRGWAPGGIGVAEAQEQHRVAAAQTSAKGQIHRK